MGLEETGRKGIDSDKIKQRQWRYSTQWQINGMVTPRGNRGKRKFRF